MGRPSFETLHVYQLAEKLSDEVWDIVIRWGLFARDTIGKQLVRSADSIGSNIAEGCGRGSYADNKRHIHIARGSLYETICGLRRAATRKLITPEQAQALSTITNELSPRLNAYLGYIIKQIKNGLKSEKPSNNNP
jgi:four helix bundle protein